MDTGRTRRIRRFASRNSTAARALTLCLLVLAASPFSAPFRTFDFAQSGHSMPAGATAQIKTSLHYATHGAATLGVSTFDMVAAPWDVLHSRIHGQTNGISGHRSW